MTMSSFTAINTEPAEAVLNEVNPNLSEEAIPSCFSDCNQAGALFRIINGWNANETGEFINACTSSCEQQNE